MKTNEFADTRLALIEAKRWLASLGLSDSQMPRLNRLIPYLDKCIAKKGAALPENERYEYVSTLLDSYSFAEMHRHFANLGLNLRNEKTTLGKIKLACRTRLLGKETDTKARDHLFELDMACFFGKYHLDVKQYDDVQLVVDGTPINMECKRISSDKQFGSNLQHAVTQLQASFKDDHSRGCIALSLEKIIDHDGNIGGDRNLVNQVSNSSAKVDGTDFGLFLSQEDSVLAIARHGPKSLISGSSRFCMSSGLSFDLRKSTMS